MQLAAKHRKEDEARLLREQLMARDGGNDPRGKPVLCATTGVGSSTADAMCLA